MPAQTRPLLPKSGNFLRAGKVTEKQDSEADFARLARHWRQLFQEADCLSDPAKRRRLLQVRGEYQRLQLALAAGETQRKLP